MYMYSHSLTAAVQGVEVTALNATAVTVSWNALVIPDFSIDHYTVLYSRVESQRRRRQDGAIRAQFPSTATSGLIAGLDSPVGLDKLCQHNFENNRYSQEYENNAGIIGKAFCVIIT